MQSIFNSESAAQQTSIIGRGTGILAVSLIGGYLWQQHQVKKKIKDKPSKKIGLT